MENVKCTKCGGTLKFNQGDMVGVCESCGNEQTLANLKEKEESRNNSSKPTKETNKRIISIVLKAFACVAFIVLTIFSCSLMGIHINSSHFPDPYLMGAVRRFDTNKNDWLSKKEIEEAKTLFTSGPCSDLTGIEKFPNLEEVHIGNCSDLSGIEKVTNLKELSLSGNCPDLSHIENLSNLETIEIWNCVFSETFVFDNDASVKEVKFHDCVFENGIIFKNNSVEYVEFGYCGGHECVASGDFDFKDCDSLSGFNLELDTNNFDIMQEQSCNIDLSGCNNLEWVSIWSEREQRVPTINLSNCNKLRSVSVYDLHHGDDVAEITLNICGSPNIDYVLLPNGIKKLDISNCPHLISASEQTPHEGEYHHGIVYESEDGRIKSDNEQIEFIK